MSNYLIERSPNKYGGNQEGYLVKVKEIVNQAAGRFSSALQEKSDLTLLFHNTLQWMGEERNKLALEHKTKNGEKFGIRRDMDSSPSGETALSPITSLYEPYDEYNAIMLKKLQPILAKMKHTLTDFTQTSCQIMGEPCLGRASSMNIEIINKDNDKAIKVIDFENCVKMSELCGLKPPQNENDKFLFLNKLLSDSNALAKLKKASLEDYKLLKINKVILDVRDVERWKEWKKSDWVYITIRLEIDNKMYALSNYLTWMYRDFKEDPVEHMTGKAGITIMHQDKFLIPSTLNDAAKIFSKALLWNKEKESLDTLKDNTALFVYELSHAMPHLRGSAAITEWFEQSIFLSLGYRLKYAKNKMVNMEALTSMPAEFVKNYKNFITLEPATNY